MAAGRGEVVFLVKVNLLLFLGHILEVYVGPSLANTRTAELNLLLLVHNEVAVLAENALKSGHN